MGNSFQHYLFLPSKLPRSIQADFSHGNWVLTIVVKKTFRRWRGGEVKGVVGMACGVVLHVSGRKCKKTVRGIHITQILAFPCCEFASEL